MLSVLPYHQITTHYFQEQTSVWQFFASHIQREETLQAFKTDLLKNTYKFDATSDAHLYKAIDVAKEKLGLSLTVSIYQDQNIEEVNASIVYLNEEAHIVFSGKLMQLLSEEELLAIIAHELSHVQLYKQLNGAVEITDRIISSLANHPESTPAHYETARLFKLYTEIFCDRGAYLVTSNYKPIISSLVKIATGLQTVNADSYIRQAEDIFAVDSATKTLGISHPENFIRARAIWLWHTKGVEGENAIQQMIEGSTGLDELDLFKQRNITAITEALIKVLLQPTWMQTPITVGLGKQYFPQLELNISPNKVQLSSHIENLHGNLKDYLAYVLYDFATADKELEDVPLGYCFFLAEELKLDLAFATAVKKEKKLTDKKTANFKKQTLAEFHKQDMQLA